MSAQIIFVGLILALVIMDIVATVKATRYAGSTAGQKLLQIVLIWLLPVIGAILVLALTRDGLGRHSGEYPKEINNEVGPENLSLGGSSADGD